ncbi:hypothetical protein M569_17084, partial [Genlisea aurea]
EELENLRGTDTKAEAFVMAVEEQFLEGLTNDENNSSSCNREMHVRAFGNVLGPLFSKLAVAKPVDADTQITEMSCQIDDYELLVGQLKEELRLERLKAKEEAEDLEQEMAELRYQLTSRLDEECKRRATIENISLQRITALEAQ